MDQPLVSVIILNYNGLHFLDECLRSVLSQEYVPFEVILVDNNSTDGSASFVAERFPSVRLIRSDENRGYAGGNNLGVSHARGELVVLLNNDTTVEPRWLEELVRAVKPRDVAVASSLVITQGIPEKYYERNGSINLLGHNIMRVFDKPEMIFYAGGTSLIFKKNLLGEPFDESYFAYSEDVYLSLRARFMGYKVVHVPLSVVHHAGGGTARKTPRSRVTMLQERNRTLNILIFFSRPTLLKLVPFFALNLPAKLLFGLTRRYSLTGILQAHLWLLLHIPEILAKRYTVHREFRRDEKEVIALVSGRMTNGESAIGRLIDRLSIAYCRAVRLETIEVRSQHPR
jgi:GT2 family glycosyltransferase